MIASFQYWLQLVFVLLTSKSSSNVVDRGHLGSEIPEIIK